MSRISIAAIIALASGILVVRLLGGTAASKPARAPAVHAPPWQDRADRVPPPTGYIPAWQVSPPRPHADPPPAIPDGPRLVPDP